MKTLFFLVSCMVLFSCKKENSLPKFPQGIYVEQTMRLDTMDFTINNVVLDGTVPQFKFNAPIDLTNPIAPVIQNSIFQFIIKSNNSIDLLNFLSSNSNYVNYYFNWQTEANSFEIDKFFTRNNLPTRLRFVKL
jgi:hypothetical protein